MIVIADAILICLVLVLLYPRPLSATLKRVVPILWVLVAAVCVIFAIQISGEKTITVTALDQRNGTADGSEIVIMSVKVDGVEYLAAEVFSSGWINENGLLRWRNYDQIPNMKKAVVAQFPKGSEVDILFETNRWRGIVQVQEGNRVRTVYRVDCYSDGNESGETLSYHSERALSGVRISGPILFLCIFVSLVILAIGFSISSKQERVVRPGMTRETWLDVLKVISAPMVILIHTAGWPYNHSAVGSKEWIVYLVINTIPRFAVPVFIMISGILLIGKEHTPQKTWIRIKRAVILLIIWNLIYIFVQHLVQDTSENIIDQITALPVLCGPNGLLWYAHFLVGLYLFAPIVSILYETLSPKMRIYFVAITVVIPGTLDLYQRYFQIKAREVVLTTSLWMTLSYMGIMFMGKIIYDEIDKIKRPAIASVVVLSVGFLGAVMITYSYGIKNNISPHNFYMETQIFPALYGCGVIGLAAVFRESIKQIPMMCKRVITCLSQYSIGIYFIHGLIQWMLGGSKLFPWWPLNSDGPLELIEIAAIYYILSVICVSLISKIPPLKKLVT